MSEKLQAYWDAAPQMAEQLHESEKAAKAELEALRRDAERYRWLRDVGGKSWSIVGADTLATGAAYDAAIDAAMEKR